MASAERYRLAVPLDSNPLQRVSGTAARIASGLEAMNAWE
jgi:hypothetical protein